MHINLFKNTKIYVFTYKCTWKVVYNNMGE
jgi:hypothetical protein